MFVETIYRVGPIDSKIAITDDAVHHRPAVYKLCWQQR